VLTVEVLNVQPDNVSFAVLWYILAMHISVGLARIGLVLAGEKVFSLDRTASNWAAISLALKNSLRYWAVKFGRHGQEGSTLILG
jgi:hypothetical protein